MISPTLFSWSFTTNLTTALLQISRLNLPDSLSVLVKPPDLFYICIYIYICSMYLFICRYFYIDMTLLDLCAAKRRARASEPWQLLVSLFVYNPVITLASFLWAPTCAQQVYWGRYKMPDLLPLFLLHVAILIYQHSFLWTVTVPETHIKILMIVIHNAQVLFCTTACLNIVFQGLILRTFFLPSSIASDLAALN